MKLFYYSDPIGNFGDDLNPWLWPRLFPIPLENAFNDETLFVGIGSILNQKIPDIPPRKIVFGSGYGYGSIPIIDQNWTFYCVRGPITAQILGLAPQKAICDGALLVRKLMEPASSSIYPVSFMPHHQTSKYDDWKSICEDLSIRYIDPSDSVDRTLNVIKQSALVITEAMHGAIVADVFRVPWIPVRTRKRILDLKWRDWASSLNMEHHFEWLTPSWSRGIDRKYKQILHPVSSLLARERLKWIIRFGQKRLSDEKILNRVFERMDEAFNKLTKEENP